jgi:hypothetical protein
LKKVLVCGDGHLGDFFYEISKDHFDYFSTFRSSEKKRKNKQFYLDSNDLNITDFLLQPWDAVIFAMPPHEGYLAFLRQFHQTLKQKVPWIFISSTSVYSEGEITEESVKIPTRKNGETLIEIESFLESLERPVCIIRPSGLVDQIRNPANFFKSGVIPAPNGWTNLVHTEDVARFIGHVIEKELYQNSFNLASKHYLKSFFYQSLRPELKISDNSDGIKKILNTKTFNSGFSYKFPDLLKYFSEL